MDSDPRTFERRRLRFIQVAGRPAGRAERSAVAVAVAVVAKSSSPSFQVLHCYECVVVGRH